MAKSELRMNRGSGAPSLPKWDVDWQNQVTVQLLGLGVAVVGALLFFSLRSAETLPWLVRMAGWTAPLVALGLLLVGGVIVLGERAGYWSPEALVGGELLLLGLQIGTYTGQNTTFSWNFPADGSNGGLIGTILGGLLVAGFGQGIAATLAFLLCVAGALLLIRYSPLIYPAAILVRIVQWLLACWAVFTAPRPHAARPARRDVPPPRTANFVAPEPVRRVAAADRYDGYAYDDTYDDGEDDVDGAADAPAPRRRTKSKPLPVAAAQPKSKRRGRTPKPVARSEELPPLELLQPDQGHFGMIDVEMLQELIEGTLEDFGVPVRVVHVESGPTVTQFGVEPLYLERSGQRRKVRVNRIVNLADDLALALAAPAVRIEAPVPGRPYVGIEVPNSSKVLVSLRGILESSAMRQSTGKLRLALGRDTSGEPVVMDLARAPHLLIAGATGSGKSVCINTIITSLLMQHGPESLRLIMVDPKMVELPGYNGIPHLLGKVITDVNQVMGALTWLLLQMDDRYRAFRELGVRNIETYNELARKRRKGKNALEPLPYIVLVIDELADLMMTAAEDIERQLCRLAQMARATGIHLILATQRPSTDVVTGLIKANFPSRIAFAVTSQTDSRVILDTPGAEHLLGQGDMLVLRPDAAKLTRVQGCYVADSEINQIVDFWKQRGGQESGASVPPWNGLMDRMDEKDELIQEAIDILRDMQTCSTSMLQRKLRIGYPKAARLMEQLEAEGVVGPDMGGGQGREVLLHDEAEEDDDEYAYEDEEDALELA